MRLLWIGSWYSESSFQFLNFKYFLCLAVIFIFYFSLLYLTTFPLFITWVPLGIHNVGSFPRFAKDKTHTTFEERYIGSYESQAPTEPLLLQSPNSKRSPSLEGFNPIPPTEIKKTGRGIPQPVAATFHFPAPELKCPLGAGAGLPNNLFLLIYCTGAVTVCFVRHVDKQGKFASKWPECVINR